MAERAADMDDVDADLRYATLRVRDVTMDYRSPIESLKGLDGGSRFLARVRMKLGMAHHTVVHALKGVSFTAYQGEQIGIMGQNGSGKSTLMRIMAGVQPPTSGLVEATATPSLLSINPALVRALSGTRNIELGLYALGKTPREVKELLPQIAAFADIGEAINRPMQTYSSGMGARVSFAIVAAAEPKILLLDEALGAGDAGFAERSARAVKQLRARAGTIIMVSHAAQEIERTCTRALWLHDGELIADGPAKETARKYRWWAWNVAQNKPEVAAKLIADAREEFAEVIASGTETTLGTRRNS